MDCPKCDDQTLEALTVNAVEVDRCPGCGGVWFDEKELPSLLDARAPDLSPLTGGREDPDRNVQTGDCPRDGESLLQVYSIRDRTLILDVCPTCRGIWLDGGEFARLKE